ncbi:MAG: tRNA pseudouridine(38-40) synthase TruA [Actinobacteria bacterium]|nr:tRNA pseudouridine(38-40) synthase TruA [Actinomycetota bacterium]
MNAEHEPAALRRARLVVAYDGSGFHGFAETPDHKTVMGVLRAAIERVAGRPVELVGAGRTDAGVHAWGQVVSGDLPAHVDLHGLVHRVNRMCGPRVVVRSADWAASPEFSARFDARYRHYRYDVLNAEVPVPALAHLAWHISAPLNLWAMQLACDPVIGEHDFSSFCRAPKVREGQPVPSLRRRVLQAEWHEVSTDLGMLLRFEVRANAFCHQMVRSLVGTMVDMGLGRIHPGDMRGILLAHDRAAAGQVAPPHGLTLWEVGY